MTTTETIQGTDIAAEVAQKTGDLSFRHISHSQMMMLVRKGLAEMAMVGAYDVKGYEALIPENMRIKLPDGIVQIRIIYLFNGEDCDYNGSQVVEIKTNFKHKGGAGYLARQKGGNSNYIINDTWWASASPGNLYYGGIQGGYLMLSSNCAGFKRVHIEYEGIGQTDHDCRVPIFAHQALVDYVHHEAAQYREFENPQYWGRVIERKQEEMRSQTGSWITARTRFGMMDKAARATLYAALTRFPP